MRRQIQKLASFLTARRNINFNIHSNQVLFCCLNFQLFSGKKKKERISRKRYYIIAYTSLRRVYILLFFEPCYRRSNSALVYFDNFLERTSRAYSISCLIKGSKFTSSEILRKPEKFKFEIVYSLVKRTETR